MLANVAGVAAIGLDAALITEALVLLLLEGSETPLVRHNNLLVAGEFVLRTAEGLKNEGNSLLTATDGDKRLADVHTGADTLGLAPSVTHTGLETISTGARKHLVDTKDVEGVNADTHVESLLADVDHEVLVAGDTGSLKSLGRDLLLLAGDHVDTAGEGVNISRLLAKIEDAKLAIGHTTAETGLGERLVLAIPVATRRTTTHTLLSSLN